MKARAVLSLLSDAGAIAEEPGDAPDGGASEVIGGGGAVGETRMVSVDAADVGPASSPGTKLARGRGHGDSGDTDVLVLDARGADEADLFRAVRVAGALHCPAVEYTTKDRLPAAVHAARRAALQPALVVYDDGSGGDADAAALATKLVSVAGFNAVFVLSGGLRAAAAAAPRLLEGDAAPAFVAGVLAEAAKRTPRDARRAATARGSGDAGGGGAGGGSVASGAGESRGSVSSRVSGATRSTFGGSKRF
jgi:hypothetical protein